MKPASRAEYDEELAQRLAALLLAEWRRVERDRDTAADRATTSTGAPPRTAAHVRTESELAWPSR
jgi:hypothetical protein